MPYQDIVCEGKPAQNRENLVTAANCELAQAPIAEAGVDAFAWGPAFIDALAVRAVHPPAPGFHAWAIIPARRIGISAMLAVGRRAVDLDPLGRGPFDVLILVEPTVDEMALRAAIEAREPLQHRPHQTPIRADRSHIHGNGDLPVGDACDLTVVDRPEAAITHLHDPRLRV